MNESALQWLTERASPPGTLACGLRRPDGNFVCHSVEESCPTATMEKILSQFDSVAEQVFMEFPEERWSTWSFEQGQIRFVKREDGSHLALVVRTASEAVTALDLVSMEFLSLQLES